MILRAALLFFYHIRAAFSWTIAVLPFALIVTLAALTITAPPRDRDRDLLIALEGGMPMVMALFAAPLLVSEGERGTLVWLAVRRPLLGILGARLIVLSVYLEVCCVLVALMAALCWHTSPPWGAVALPLPPTLAFVALSLLAANWGRSPMPGYLISGAVWLGVLFFGSLLPMREPWLTLNPFAWSAGFGPPVVLRSKLFYAAVALLLLLPQWWLARPPERLMQTI